MDLRVIIPDAEFRGVEEKEGRYDAENERKYPNFLVVRIDDPAGYRHELIDRDTENIGKYKRGLVADIEAIVKYGFNKGGGGWMRLEIKSFKAKE